MEAPQEEQSAAGASAGTAGPGQELQASDEALTFMSSIEPAELLKCVFADSLVTVSEGGRDLGKFSVQVEFAHRLQQPCMLLHTNVAGGADLQEAPKHGDAFICCILSHGNKGEVLGTDEQPLSIKQITRTFKATEQSTLKGKPKVFLIQADQGGLTQRDLQADDTHSTVIAEEADFLVAIATVEDHVSWRHKTDGSWFIQSLCQQLKERCPGSEEIRTILDNVIDEVGEKEASEQPGESKQIPVVWYTLRKSLVLSPQASEA